MVSRPWIDAVDREPVDVEKRVGRVDMDGLTLVVLLALASTLAMAGARAVLGAVLHLMTMTLVPAPVQRPQDPTPGA